VFSFVILILGCLWAVLLGTVYGWAVDLLPMSKSEGVNILIFLVIELFAVLVGLVGAKVFIALALGR